MNEKVSEEGLKGDYGLQVGSKIIQKGNFNLFSNDASNKIMQPQQQPQMQEWMGVQCL